MKRYLNELPHSNLEKLVQYCMNMERASWKDEVGYRLLFYSPDPLILKDLSLQNAQWRQIELVALSREKELNQELKAFFDSESHDLLVVIANVL